ncbi:MAG: OadG family protein [Tannerella sp.]|jgi:oxaloacetate decarboxylase gamma subunit|nr:OadG family protein [Tannerella sp.]
MEHFEFGLLLMVVGMLTVFAILLLVIGLGKGLIALVNKYFPEQAAASGSTVNVTAVPDDKNIPGSTAAVIVSAVSVLTAGRGKVTKIEKQSY